MKQMVTNGVTTPSYPCSAKTTKNLIFAQNSCQPMINTVNINLKSLTVDLCETRWFFILLISVCCIATFNMSLTLWMINALHLNNNGLGYGSFILTKKGINIKGDIVFDRSLDAKLIKPFDGEKALNFNSDDFSNIVMKNNDFLENSLTLGNGKLEIQATNFQIRSTNPALNSHNSNDILFNIEPNEITTYTQNFMFPSLGGYKIINSLESNSIRGDLFHDLRLESRTQGVNIAAEENINFDSRGGDIKIISFDNLNLKSKDLIAFNTRRLEMKYLKKYYVSNADIHNGKISYQLCVCESGRLFVVKPDSVCKTDAQTCRTKVEGINFEMNAI